jgi:hypothetical protein
MGNDTITVPGNLLIACENAYTPSRMQKVDIDPPHNYHVDLRPMFHDGVCLIPAPPCVDVGNECGNSCDVPTSGSCSYFAKLFGLNITRFEQLNPKLNCAHVIPAGTEVCQGGSCGDRRRS